jgi:hypothetical protein
MALPAPFVRPSADDQVNLARPFSATGRQRGRTRKIFVIKQTSRLPSTSARDKKIQRILIFDNHPDSLRLVFGRRANSYVDRFRRQRISLWELLIVSILLIAGLVGMFWPLFEILAR